MNYLARFGMEFNPFNKNAKQLFIETHDAKQLLFRLKHLEEINGIGLITGEPGLGKTTIIRKWANSLNKSLYKVIYIAHSSVTLMEFYRVLSDEFGLQTTYSKRINFNNIRDEINRLVIEKRITPVIILDEANYLSASILNDLKLLLNFDMDSKDKVILLLVGQNVIRNNLNLKVHEALKQRISINYSQFPLDKDEARTYIDDKLKFAGLNTSLLSDDAYNQIINFANGTMRIIDQVMDKALLILCNKKGEVIDGEIAMEAINEVNI